MFPWLCYLTKQQLLQAGSYSRHSLELESIQRHITHRETDPLSFGLDALQSKCVVLLYTHKWPGVTALHRADYSFFFFLTNICHTIKCQDHSNQVFAICMEKQSPVVLKEGLQWGPSAQQGKLTCPSLPASTQKHHSFSEQVWTVCCQWWGWHLGSNH